MRVVDATIELTYDIYENRLGRAFHDARRKSASSFVCNVITSWRHIIPRYG